MLVVAGWFRTSSAGREAADEARQQRLVRACQDLSGDDWPFHSLRGDGWGFVVTHAPAPGWRWPFVTGVEPSARLLTLSIGLPVGSEAAGPAELGTRLLAGGAGTASDIHGDVVPPFALIAVERGSGRAAVQQDWLGMARLFTRSGGGVLALSTRPSLIPVVDGGAAAPDLDAWAGFASTGAFCGEDAPVGGVRLLAPGERLVLGARDGVWEVRRENRASLDELVQRGQERRGREGSDLDALSDEAARGITRVAASVGRMYTEPIQLGLSGGKDSRVIAAALIAAGMTPVLSTNTTTPAEGVTASELVERLRSSRGLELDHRLHKEAVPAKVLTHPLLERAERLRQLYDGQFPSTYLARAAVTVVPAQMRPPSFSGAGGEILTGYWHPPAGSQVPPDMTAVLLEKICVLGDVARLSPFANQAYTEKVTAAAAEASKAGLSGTDVTDYTFLTTRIRRWSPAGYHPGMVNAFLAPEVVVAAFALSGEQKAAKALHLAMLDRLVPEWAGIPFVSISTGRNAATRIWDGDGLATLQFLASSEPGSLAAMIDRDAVRWALGAAVTPRPAGYAAKVLEQFGALAVADAHYGTGPALAPGRLQLAVKRAARTRARARWFAGRVRRRVRRALG